MTDSSIMSIIHTVHLKEDGQMLMRGDYSDPIKGRIFTIAYQIFPGGKVKYAGCVFNSESKKEMNHIDQLQNELLNFIQSNNDPLSVKCKILQYAKLEDKKLNMQRNSHWNRSGNVKTAKARLELRPLWASIPSTCFDLYSNLIPQKTYTFCSSLRSEVKKKEIKSLFRL